MDMPDIPIKKVEIGISFTEDIGLDGGIDYIKEVVEKTCLKMAVLSLDAGKNVSFHLVLTNGKPLR